MSINDSGDELSPAPSFSNQSSEQAEAYAPDREASPASPSKTDRSALKGFGLAIALQLIQVLALLIFPPAVFLIGVSQLLYIIPAILIALQKGNPKLALGIAIGAAVVFLLNATCFGLVMYSFRNGIH